MRNYFFLLLTLSLALVIASCNSITEPLLPLVNNEVRATVSDYGTFDSNNSIPTFDNTSYSFVATVRGVNTEDTISLTITIPKQAAVPYTVQIENDDIAEVQYSVLEGTGVYSNFVVKRGIGSGAITVNNISTDGSSTTVEGSFTANVVPDGFSAAGKQITSGEFKIVF